MRKTEDNIRKIIDEAWKLFLGNNDQVLLSVDANERSITHIFAMHLKHTAQQIDGSPWHVDCEYNRNGEDIKKIEAIESIVGKSTKTSETKTKTVYPDIIIHKRGSAGPNLLVIEAKKDATQTEKEEDIAKLGRLKEMFGYDFAVFLNFRTRGIDGIDVDFVQ